MRIAPLLLALLLPLGASTAAGKERKDALAEAIAGRVPGKPVDCVSLTNLQGPQIIDRTAIFYRDGARLWRTGPVGRCPSLRPFSTLIVSVHGGQLCRNDRFRLLAPQERIPSAECRFTGFTPYDRPERAGAPGPG